MKRIIISAVILITAVEIAYADKFQISYRNGDEKFNVAHSSVKVHLNNNNVVFEGYTDKYGRISIKLSNKNYELKVYYRKKWRKKNIKIDGSKKLKKIYVK